MASTFLPEWDRCHPDDLWVYDKLILSKKLGYICGPKGADTPKPGKYLIKPCVNFMGMGRGAKILNLRYTTDFRLPDGFFWMEIFRGKHLSIDYYKGQQRLCVEGFRTSSDLSKWDRWQKTSDKIPFPKIQLKGNYKWVNIEMIDGNIIEIHLRRNPDFCGHTSPYITPSYGRKKLKGHTFIKGQDYKRIGYFIKCQH